MNGLKTAMSAVVLAGLSMSAYAENFDITMDVVGAEESFDEVIVNRISLPFSSKQPERPEPISSEWAQDVDVLAEDVLQAVEQSLDTPELGETLNVINELEIVRPRVIQGVGQSLRDLTGNR